MIPLVREVDKKWKLVNLDLLGRQSEPGLLSFLLNLFTSIICSS